MLCLNYYFCLINLETFSHLKIFKNLSDYSSNSKTFITIGTFDGVHIGHQKVLKKLTTSAHKKDAKSVLLTFFPHPRMVLQKDIDIKLINTIDERIQLLEKTGIDTLVIYKFTKKISKISALEFVRNILVNILNVSKLIVGYDHHFGRNREGSFEQLKDYGYTYDFKVKKITKKEIDTIAVSSTKIRKAIANGEIEKANNYLGYHFMLTGDVVPGKNLGGKIGYPTANLHIEETYKLIPKTGAYIVKSLIDNELVFGMMNIGFRPTVSGKNQTIEIHFFNFDKNIYGQKIQVDVLHFLRQEQKFESIEALKKQLKKDKEISLQYINGVFFE